MTLNTSGCLLEGIRTATGNSPYTYPPRSIILNDSTLNASDTLGRADYLLLMGYNPLVSSPDGVEIADPNVIVYWSRNDASIARFDYNAYARRWDTQPGGVPTNLGPISNTMRLKTTPPDQTISNTEAPYLLYVGLPAISPFFTVNVVETDADFSSPGSLPAGTAEISLATGDLNFSSMDVNNMSYAGQPVYVSLQTFLSRKNSTGVIGQLPASSVESYQLYIAPVPGTGQIPRIRIGYNAFLNVIPYASDALLETPPSGSVAVSYASGKLVFAPADITANASSNVYYSGMLMGGVPFIRTTIGLTNKIFPTAVGTEAVFANANLDSQRYVFFAEPPNAPRYYFNVVLGNSNVSALGAPAQGQVMVDVFTGSVYISATDAHNLSNVPLIYIDSVLTLDTARGVGVQFYRSGVNGSGSEITPDFVILYTVTQQIVQDNITASPFITLPTTPITDANLAVFILPGTNGSTGFTGQLANSDDPNLQGFGYYLNLDKNQLYFTNRKTVKQTLQVATSSVKLQDAAIVSNGFEVTRNNVALDPGVDFQFDPNAGVLNFLTPVGEDDPTNILGIAGAVQPNLIQFVSDQAVFSLADIGKFLFFSSGPNTGLYEIIGIGDTNTATVTPSLVVAQPDTADLRAEREVVADRFFTAFQPPLKNITVMQAASMAGPFFVVPQSQYTIFTTTGQISLATPTTPGQVFQVTYVWAQSPDNGVTVTPTTVTEFAGFKIRQEQATVQVGSTIATFNPGGNTVITSNPNTPIVVYVDGVSLTNSAGTVAFMFTAPGTITTNQVFTSSTQVVIDYYVTESPGGNTYFKTANTPLSIDFAQIVGGSTSATFNGDQTSLVQKGCAFLINGKDIVLAGDTAYNATTDLTTVLFNPFTTAPVASNYDNTSNSGSPISICAPIFGTSNPNYFVTETNGVDIVPKGSSSITIQNQVNYPNGTIVLLNQDPYLVASSTYDSTKNVTTVTIADTALTNYVMYTLQRTIRPVLSAGASFQTAQSAYGSFPFTLVRGGTNPAVLTLNIDYSFADGGLVTLKSAVGYGDTLSALYVARAPQAVGTAFIYNYAYQIAPSTSNGLLGQQVAITYDLYNPDTFYYRIETIVTFIPEVIQYIQQTSSTSMSGPNTANKSSLALKDQGSPSLYWSEQHYGNLDTVISRLLQFYNDLINIYEDILSDLDGRVVGGNSGRFRFDGNSIVVTTYAEIMNDIDDSIVLYENVGITGFSGGIPIFSEVPVYGYMYQPNRLSRIFPTANPYVTVALNNKTAVLLDFGNILGSTFISNLTSVGAMSTSKASSTLVSAVASGTSTIALALSNGNSAQLNPPFAVGNSVQFYNPDGSPNSVEGTISSITGPSGTPQVWTITVSGVAVTMNKGGIVTDPFNPSYSPSADFYIPGKDMGIDFNGGFFTNNALPPPFGSASYIVKGNELVDTSVTYVNQITTPYEMPVLTGQTVSDNGRPPVPPLSRIGELDYLGYETTILGEMGTGSAAADLMTINGATLLPNIGNVIEFTAGPNAGLLLTVATVLVTSFTVTPNFNSASGAETYYIVPSSGSLTYTLNGELGVLQTNVEVAPVLPSLIGPLNSELISIENAIISYGEQQAAGTGTATAMGTVLTDASANFASAEPPITTSSLLYVSGGPNQGLYTIASLTDTTITIAAGPAPYPLSFPSSASCPYIVLLPWSFLSNKEPQFATAFLPATLMAIAQTTAWAASPTAAGAAARLAQVQSRQTAVATFITQIQGLCGSNDNLYNTRYLWIQQRTDMTNGTLAREVQAQNQRITNTANLIASQQKLYITSLLA